MSVEVGLGSKALETSRATERASISLDGRMMSTDMLSRSHMLVDVSNSEQLTLIGHILEL